MLSFSTSDTNGPRKSLQDGWRDKRVCLSMAGGVGDVVMTVLAVAKKLQKIEPCHVTAAVLPHQFNMVGSFGFVEDCIDVNSIHQATVQNQFDILLDFWGVFTENDHLVSGGYYNHISAFTGFSIIPPFCPELRTELLYKERQVIAIHPGASNPNRRWAYARYKSLADSLINAGYAIMWLGTSEELGYSHEYAIKVSDNSEDLGHQFHALSTCKYFIGNDSGFAHLAGCLEIPGLVILGATKFEDVFRSYKTLYGVNRVTRPISRTLNPNDRDSIINMSNVQVHNVLSVFQMFLANDVKDIPETLLNDIKPPRRNLWIVSGDVPACEEIFRGTIDIASQYDYIDSTSRVCGHLHVDDAGILVVTPKRTAFIPLDHPETMQRALREIHLS